jgi:hypothetical protein
VPVFEFRCRGCGASTDVTLVNRAQLDDVDELICRACGGGMRRAYTADVHLVLNSERLEREEREFQAKRRKLIACCGTSACRCSVKLTKPNPFREQVPTKAQIVDDMLGVRAIGSDPED